MKWLSSRRNSRLSSLPSVAADLFAGAVIISALLFGLADSVYLIAHYVPSLVRNTLNSRTYELPEEDQLDPRRRTIYVVRRNDDLLDNGFYGNSSAR